MEILKNVSEVTINKGSGMANGLFNLTIGTTKALSLWFDDEVKDELMALSNADFLIEANKIFVESEINNTISLNDYAKLMKYDGENETPTLLEIQENLEEFQDLTVWDYPIEEYIYVLTEVNESVVFVQVTEDSIRICES